MEKLAYLLPVLGCAVMMGAMMLMMRGGHGRPGPAAAQPDPSTQEEIAMLRAEIAGLRAAQVQPAAPAEEADHSRPRGGPA